ncbi:hypothetical protein NLG97_g730 [Lecanicillium saksenae]|uniref:Uncharacterized protein n=1 Tax=Lecanicillium saksenae TaxID=468837 RepID=A0ACC1R9U4_9HYPO|nr:hypothetical protein NLG97_g730 [Lecanicillium saksenae]
MAPSSGSRSSSADSFATARTTISEVDSCEEKCVPASSDSAQGRRNDVFVSFFDRSGASIESTPSARPNNEDESGIELQIPGSEAVRYFPLGLKETQVDAFNRIKPLFERLLAQHITRRSPPRSSTTHRPMAIRLMMLGGTLRDAEPNIVIFCVPEIRRNVSQFLNTDKLIQSCVKDDLRSDVATFRLTVWGCAPSLQPRRPAEPFGHSSSRERITVPQTSAVTGVLHKQWLSLVDGLSPARVRDGRGGQRGRGGGISQSGFQHHSAPSMSFSKGTRHSYAASSSSSGFPLLSPDGYSYYSRPAGGPQRQLYRPPPPEYYWKEPSVVRARMACQTCGKRRTHGDASQPICRGCNTTSRIRSHGSRGIHADTVAKSHDQQLARIMLMIGPVLFPTIKLNFNDLLCGTTIFFSTTGNQSNTALNLLSRLNGTYRNRNASNLHSKLASAYIGNDTFNMSTCRGGRSHDGHSAGSSAASNLQSEHVAFADVASYWGGPESQLPVFKNTGVRQEAVFFSLTTHRVSTCFCYWILASEEEFKQTTILASWVYWALKEIPLLYGSIPAKNIGQL